MYAGAEHDAEHEEGAAGSEGVWRAGRAVAAPAHHRAGVVQGLGCLQNGVTPTVGRASSRKDSQDIAVSAKSRAQVLQDVGLPHTGVTPAQ